MNEQSPNMPMNPAIRVFVVLFVIATILGVGVSMDVIRVSYPVRVDVDPLIDPQQVAILDDDTIQLLDGRELAVAERWTLWRIEESNREVDLEPDPADATVFHIYARVLPRNCRLALVHIPIVPKKIVPVRREIGIGTLEIPGRGK